VHTVDGTNVVAKALTPEPLRSLRSSQLYVDDEFVVLLLQYTMPMQPRAAAHCCWHVNWFAVSVPLSISSTIVLLMFVGAHAVVDGHIATLRVLVGQPVASPPRIRFAM